MKLILQNKLSFSVFFICLLIASSCGGGSSSKSVLTSHLSYEGISFDYPEKWKTNTEVLAEGSYYIECEDVKNDVDLFIVTFLTDDSDPKVLMEDYIENLNNSIMTVTAESATSGKFGDYDCIVTKYKASYLGSNFYGSVSAIKAGGKAIIVVRQSDTKERSESRFKEIENSFKVQ